MNEDGEDDRPRRVRVAFDPAVLSADSSRTHGIALPGSPVREAESVFLTDLMRAQLRLAGACLIGFILASLLLTAAIVVLASTVDPVLFGVPLSWLLQAYAYYPVILFFAIVFARNAARNERRFRMLADEDDDGEGGAR
ncbi:MULTISPECIES: heavy metal transporter [unclassified Microbacterium]|uniref:heavy metal transporter n=1 Tax=unclassified Microbacterium TaxID=2609290 RepID=UPI0012FB6275|nr:heavy metal transporter [Microbacterium sp. MAH-37]MVQ40589.1 heavy metal transporter [Microbacterium sp. MAH-37]